MLSLSAKKGESLEVYALFVNRIKTTAGDQVATRLCSTMRQMQEARDNVIQSSCLLEDTKALEYILVESQLYLSMWTSVCHNFTFGKHPASIDVSFVWTDSYTGRQVESCDPLSERVSVLYNMGVIYNELGIKLAVKAGDYRDAIKKFFTAAWIFEELEMEVCRYKADELGIDLSRHNILMCAEMMKAQAQYCAHDEAHLKEPSNYGLLSRLAIQASNYYSSACRYAAMDSISKFTDTKNYTKILHFNKYSFKARAYYWACMECVARWEKQGTGIGTALRNIHKSLECLASLHISTNPLPPLVVAQYKKLLADCKHIEARLVVENSALHEPLPPLPNEIEPLVCGRPVSVAKELSCAFDGQAIMTRMSLVQVQELEEEYKKEVGQIVAKAFFTASEIDKFQSKFFAKYNLPSAFYALIKGEDFPQDLWEKIRQCKELNNKIGLKDFLEFISILSESNGQQLDSLIKRMMEDEANDLAMKEKYGVMWKRDSNTKAAKNIKTQLGHYKEKYNQGKKADEAVSKLIEKKKSRFKLLALDKATLLSRVPKSSGDKETSPVVIKYLVSTV